MKKKSPATYSDAFKWKVVQEVLSGKFNKEEARKVYGIRGNSAILYWMRKFSAIKDCRQGEIALSKLELMQNMKEDNENQNRIKELEEALERERIRADLWQKMVEIAEEDYKIDILKKSGAKLFTPSKNKKGNK